MLFGLTGLVKERYRAPHRSYEEAEARETV